MVSLDSIVFFKKLRFNFCSVLGCACLEFETSDHAKELAGTIGAFPFVSLLDPFIGWWFSSFPYIS